MLAELRDKPSVTLPVTMECAANGRARLSPRPLSQPWLVEAVGTAEWTGTPLRDVLAPAGIRPEALELVFTGADRGEQGGVEHALQLPPSARVIALAAFKDQRPSVSHLRHRSSD